MYFSHYDKQEIYLLAVLESELTQGFVLAKQALYCLRDTFSPFLLWLYGDRVLIFAQASQEHDPPIYASHHHWDGKHATLYPAFSH
jgi:hypothetical protein